jgi:hypothetical protein
LDKTQVAQLTEVAKLRGDVRLFQSLVSHEPGTFLPNIRVGSQVVCRDEYAHLLPAVIISGAYPTFTVHYNDWSANYDRAVPALEMVSEYSIVTYNRAQVTKSAFPVIKQEDDPNKWVRVRVIGEVAEATTTWLLIRRVGHAQTETPMLCELQSVFIMKLEPSWWQFILWQQKTSGTKRTLHKKKTSQNAIVNEAANKRRIVTQTTNGCD